MYTYFIDCTKRRYLKESRRKAKTLVSTFYDGPVRTPHQYSYEIPELNENVNRQFYYRAVAKDEHDHVAARIGTAWSRHHAVMTFSAADFTRLVTA